MKEKHKITSYPSKNKKTETYQDGDTFVTKHFYDAKDAYVKEFISLTDGITKIKHLNRDGVAVKLEHFLGDKRHGMETKYIIAKADGSIKSTKLYDNGKLHGENITYNDKGKIIKHEVYALGKLVLRYIRDETGEIVDVNVVDKQSIENLSAVDNDKFESFNKA